MDGTRPRGGTGPFSGESANRDARAETLPLGGAVGARKPKLAHLLGEAWGEEKTSFLKGEGLGTRGEAPSMPERVVALRVGG